MLYETVGSDKQNALAFVAGLEQGRSCIAAEFGRPADPHPRQPLLPRLRHHTFVEVLPRELDLPLVEQPLRVLPHPHHDPHSLVALRKMHQLVVDDGVEVFGLVDGDQEDEGEAGEGFGFEDGVLFEDAGALCVGFFDELDLVEQVDHVAEGEEACAAGQHDDPAGRGGVQLQATSPGAAHLDIVELEFSVLES